MSNYRIIQNENIFKEFINWLPPLKPEETFYCGLFARNKYFSEITHIKTDKEQLIRFTTDKIFMFDEIKQLECPYGSYKYKNIQIPQEALALYINPNPRNMRRASSLLIKKLIDKIVSPDKINLPQETLSSIHKSVGTKHYLVFDFDNIDIEDLFPKIISFINYECLNILKTRGGVKIIINLSKIDKKFTKTWYKNITSLSGYNYVKDQMIPVPGCVQGGFIPHFIKF